MLSFKSSGNLEGNVLVRVHSRKALKATSPRESTYHSSSTGAGSLATWALSRQLRMCCLTIRSTGPIAAGRHLGYKSLAQIPAHRNRPVSSNVRPHISNAVPRHRLKQDNGDVLLIQDCNLPKMTALRKPIKPHGQNWPFRRQQEESGIENLCAHSATTGKQLLVKLP